jgi:hypothetical protein
MKRQTSLSKKRLSYKFNYVATLDPWLRRDHKDIDRLLKLGCLTSHHLVISDNQLVNNKGLHRLLRRRDVAEFLLSPDNDGAVPIVISLRQNANSFEDVISELVVNRERPAIFPWMSPEQQSRLDHAYTGQKRKTLGPFFDIAGKAFADHVATLNRFVDAKKSTLVAWRGLQSTYLSFVETATHGFMKSVRLEGCGSRNQKNVLAVCEQLLGQIQNGSEVNRSNLSRFIADSPLRKEAKRFLELKVLHEPYHTNFASSGRFSLITGNEYHSNRLDSLFPDLASKVKTIPISDITDLELLPLSLDQIPYARIQKIRNSESFKKLTFTIQDVPLERRVSLVRDLLSLIHSELEREPRALRKLGKLRLSVLLAPQDIQTRLSEVGLSFADVMGYLSTSAAFLAGEAIGQMVGVFGIGGLAGTGAGILVEHVVDRSLIKPGKRREFGQIVQLLANNAVIP